MVNKTPWIYRAIKRTHQIKLIIHFFRNQSTKLAVKRLAALHKYFLEKVTQMDLDVDAIPCMGCWGKGSQLHAEITGNARWKSHSVDSCGNSFRARVKLLRPPQ